jgi:hypothetical protein
VKLLTFVCNKRFLYREVHWEPTVHSWGMLSWVGTIKHILVKFSSKITSKTMNFSLFLLDNELYTVKFFHGSTLALTVLLYFFLHLNIFLLWIRKVTECEDFFRFFTTWICC